MSSKSSASQPSLLDTSSSSRNGGNKSTKKKGRKSSNNNNKRKRASAKEDDNNNNDKKRQASQKSKQQATTKANNNQKKDSSAAEEKQQQQETEEMSLIPEGMLPSYLAEAFAELYEEDGLVVFGKGLGWLSLLASFVRFYADVEDGHVAVMMEDKKIRPTTKPPLVLVIGLKDNEQTTLTSILETWGTPPELLPTMITNESGQKTDRAVMYQRGGVFCITSRILIVDLLTNIAIAQQIDGILVAHAESVVEESTEAFILRIFHSQKQQTQQTTSSVVANNPPPTLTSKFGFVKGFTDAPDILVSGFAKIDKILKHLRIRRLYLYPRFHHNIQTELEAIHCSPHVDELYQELSPKMKEIQNALAAAVQSVIRELKNTTTLLEWSNSTTDAATSTTTNNDKSTKSNSKKNQKKSQETEKSDLVLSIENIVTSNFDYAISKQLEHDWHRLKPVTKQLIQDLRTLRTLFQALIQYDCISFWKLINSIKTMSAASKYPSMWLLTPAADLLFRKAKERIYTLVPAYYPTKNNQNTGQQQQPVVTKRLRPILEETPKWKLLKKVLMEISQQQQQQQEQSKPTKNKEQSSSNKNDNDSAETNNHNTDTNNNNCFQPTNVLVMVKDEKTLEGIQSYLVDGKKRTMGRRWLRYLDHCNDRLRTVIDSRGGISNVSEESRLLIEEEGRVRNMFKRTDNNQKNKQNHRVSNTNNNNGNKRNKNPYKLNQVPSYMKKRRRIATERGRGTLMHQAEDLEREAVLYEAVEQTEHELKETTDNNDENDEKARGKVGTKEEVGAKEHDDGQENDEEDPEEKENNGDKTTTPAPSFLNYVAATEAAEKKTQQPDDEEDEEDIDDIMFNIQVPNNELRVVLKSYASMNGGNSSSSSGSGGDNALLLLQDIRPKYIILYDADMAFIRSIEIYSALNSPPPPSATATATASTKTDKEDQDRIRVFFLIFEASSEEKVFMKSLEREQNAFEKLIHHKKTMPPPVWQNTTSTQEMLYAQQQGLSMGGTYCGGSLPLAFDTRMGRGKKQITTTKSGRDIVVDVREFRSALPSILHQGGMRLAPVTLTVGDFVLSSVHCVERKSISDLYGSFNSGRLYTQAESMCKHYKCPCLLIEFDPQKSFCLQNSNELGVEIRTDSICSKMVLLTMHFPKLRFLWSRSPHHTLRIFQELKTNHGEVDVTKAIEMGKDEEKKDDEQEDDDEEEDEVNEVARDMLMRLPGVNVHTARRIMQHCDSLADLAELSRMDLKKIAGPVAGQKLFTFFRQKMAAT